MKIYDISVGISPEMPTWPDDPPVILTKLAEIQNGADANITAIEMSVHSGTHIDAPKHFIDDGIAADEIPFEKLMGEVVVMEMSDAASVISAEILKTHPDNSRLQTASKVLFKTINSGTWQSSSAEFQKDYVGINKSGAKYLAGLNLDLIGIDYLSIAPYDDTVQPHTILLSKGIILLEGINLSRVPSGIYQLCCLPLKIIGCEGAPARAILVE